MKSRNIDYADINDARLRKAIIGISTNFPLRYIICWGVTSEQKQLISCFDSGFKQSHKHFFLLAITHDNTRLEHKMQDYIQNKFVDEQVAITVISHGFASVKDAFLLQGNRFYSNIFSEGFLMYSSDGLLPQIDYSFSVNDKMKSSAEEHFPHRYHMAEGFLLAAEQSLDGGYYGHGVFLLHQCTEQACIALIRVFIGYRSDSHNLKRLLDLCCCFSNKPKEIFNRRSEDEVLFDLMQKSYSQARYKDDYQVQAGDAESLYQLVHDLLTLTKTLCEERIAEYLLAQTLRLGTTLVL